MPKLKYLERLHKRNNYLIETHEEKETLVEHFTGKRPAARVIALKRMGEQQVQGASLVIEPNPSELVSAVRKLRSKARAA